MTRFYENMLPLEGDYVIAQVQSVTDLGIYVSLLEYDGLEAMIPIQDFTNRVKNTIRIGRTVVAQVTRVDPVKGFVDLTRRSIEVPPIEERWVKSKCVQSIMARVAEVTGLELEELHRQLTWPIYASRHPFDVFREILSGQVEDWIKSHPVFPVLLENIQKRLRVTSYKLRAKVDIMCWTESGVEGIREAILAGKSLSDEVNIQLEKSPTYVLSMETTEKEKGLYLLSQVCYTIQETVEKHGGRMVIQIPPYAQSEEN